MAFRPITYRITGMQCTGCEVAIEEAIRQLPGIRRVTASYPDNRVTIEYDPGRSRENQLREAIEARGYGVAKPADAPRRGWRQRVIGALQFLGLLAIVAAIALGGKRLMPDLMTQMDAQLGYAMLITIGFLTGFHCIGMCGGLVVSYTAGLSPRTPGRLALAHMQYGLGKTLAYTTLGAGFGYIGSLITFTPYLRGMAALLASVFLLIYGLKMLDVFGVLRRFALRLPKAMARSVSREAHSRRNPMLVGLFSGLLLGCGPLQAMYIMAAGTGSPREGALILLFFGLGTLLPLLSFGALASLLPRNAMQQLARASGTLLLVMALTMANRGLKLTGSTYDLDTLLMHWQHCDMDEAAMSGEHDHQP